MKIYQCFLIKNACYYAGDRMNPQGIVVHSTGANNPYISRYVQPAAGQEYGVTAGGEFMRAILGENRYNNHWNRYSLDVGADAGAQRYACVNAFVGMIADGSVNAVQTLPWDMTPWGCGQGINGSYNATHIQFEICEDDLTSKAYFDEAIAKAVELCAYLCKKFDIKVSNVVSHHESYLQGYGNNHADIDHWLKVYDMTMDDFRGMVAEKIKGGEPMTDTEKNEFKALKKRVENLETDLKNCFEIYNWTTACPEWAQATVHKLLSKGILKGRDDGQLYLSEQMIRLLVMLDRGDCFER